MILPFWRTTRDVGPVFPPVKISLSYVLEDAAYGRDPYQLVVSQISRPVREDTDTENLAYEFALILKLWLESERTVERHGHNLWNELRRRNAAEKRGTDVCHSHDFVDANMAMAEAFQNIHGREPDAGSEHDAALWNRAWTLAFLNGFEPIHTEQWLIDRWMKYPTFGRDPGTWKVLKPTQAELADILVALDYFLETGKELKR